MERDLANGEAEIFAELLHELGSHERVAALLFNAIAKAVGAPPAQPTSLKSCGATRGILIRIGNDLRSASWLALHGYPIQAATIVSSLYESAVTLMSIRSSETIADEWLNHGLSNPLSPFRSVWQLTRDTATLSGADDVDAMTETLYQGYTQLCWAKHNRSTYLLVHSYNLGTPDPGGQVGPITSPAARRTATFALDRGITLAHWALLCFVEAHLTTAEQAALTNDLDAIGQEIDRLSERTRARFTGSDPFPGKWKMARKPKLP
jgi:hypothetical protein